MYKRMNNVEIKDSPFRGSKKKKSCLARTCLSGFGCIFIFALAFLLILRFASNPKIKELKTIPKYVSESIVIYDPENIHKIELMPGENRAKLIEGMALLPKVIIAPIIVELKKIQNKENAPEEKSDKTKSYFDWDELKKTINEPVADHRNIFHIEWTDLSAQPSFVFNYYKTELRKKDFEINITSEKESVSQLTFSKGDISGALYIQDDLIDYGTDYVMLKIKIPEKKM